jgi:hypothetical protein
MTQGRRTYVFVLRIWNDGPRESERWRGSIRSVSDQRAIYFDSCEKLCGFMQSTFRANGTLRLRGLARGVAACGTRSNKRGR